MHILTKDKKKAFFDLLLTILLCLGKLIGQTLAYEFQNIIKTEIVSLTINSNYTQKKGKKSSAQKRWEGNFF